MTGRGKARKFSPRLFATLLSLYPPFLFQGIRVAEISRDFSYCRVRVRRALLTRNLGGTTFGGTIFAAADPIYAVLLWQHFAHRDLAVEVWLRAARVRYLAPARSALTLEFRIPPETFARAERGLDARRRFVEALPVEAVDRDGTVCARIETEVYLALNSPGAVKQ